MIIGVTTAATMWFATVVGFCLGGGQLILGSVATVLGCLILSSLHWAENRLDEQQRATLRMTLTAGSLSEAALRAMRKAGNVHVRSISIAHEIPERQEKFDRIVRWPAHKDTTENPEVLNDVALLPGLIELSWSPAGISPS